MPREEKSNSNRRVIKRSCIEIETLVDEWREEYDHIMSHNVYGEQLYLEIKGFIKEWQNKISALDEETRKLFPSIINILNSKLEEFNLLIEKYALEKSTQSEPFILNVFGIYLTKPEIITAAACCTVITSFAAYKKLMG